MESYDIVIVGGGPAGLAAAVSAYDAGQRSILLLERDDSLGGILNQCIHNGFGLHIFKEELTGPEYAHRYIQQLRARSIAHKLSTIVLDVDEKKTITAMNSADGLFTIQAKAIVLAMGCRERSRGALNIPGYRPAGVYSAGTAQRLVNMEGHMPGHRVVILGSGDIGLIMARRMTLEGAEVVVVAELMPYSGGLKRNIVQCLDDFNIPLKLSHTVVDIHGKERVTGVTLARVDSCGKPILGTEIQYACDTLLLSCGLIPENEISSGMGVCINPATNGAYVNEGLQTSLPGVFAAGNVLHVHDLVDFVSEEAATAGHAAAFYVASGGAMQDRTEIAIEYNEKIRYTVPSLISSAQMPEQLTLRFRVKDEIKNSVISVYFEGVKEFCCKRAIMVPSEMESVVLTRKMFANNPKATSICICVEEG